MAERRMFARSIVLSDAFLDMPMSARCLYFTLGMLADDDGFVGSPKSVMRQCGSTIDDLNILLAKRYVLGFESGVICIKHWKINNFLRNDRHQNTTYVEELKTLQLDGKGAYTEANKELGQYELCAPKERKPLTVAQKTRLEAKKESNLPYSFEQKIRNAFIGKKCPICGVTFSYANNLVKPTIQHNVPISMGGKHEIDNISVICASCNTSIQNRKITPSYNTEEVRRVWECIGNDTGMDTQDSIGKDRIDNNIVFISTNVPINTHSSPVAEESAEDEKNTIDFVEISKLYNEICKSFPKLTKLSENRKKAIRARINAGYSVADFRAMFIKAEASKFLKGANDRNWIADFDWMVRDTNMPKILEGKYDNDNFKTGRKDYSDISKEDLKEDFKWK